MIHLPLIGMALLAGMVPAFADDKPYFTTQTIKIADPHIDLENGRTYILKNGTVIEEVKLNPTTTQRNIFDFANGVVYHESPRVAGAVYSTTSFKDLPDGRVAEIRALGCRVIAESGLLVKNKGDVADFNARYCAVTEEQK